MTASNKTVQPTDGAAVEIISTGIGGAGNFRHPSVSKAVEAALDENGNPPRRFSVSSLGSSDGKPASIITVAKQMFRKGSNASVEEPKT